MSNEEIIKHIIIFDGVKEYNTSDILKSEKLTEFIKKSKLLLPLSFLPDVIKQKGKIFITVNSDFSTISFDLKDVNSELYDRYCQIYR